MAKIAFIFPGQGAQHVGMGKDVYEAFAAARHVFDEAEKIIGLPIKKLCFEGPEEELNRTDIAQPAIFTVSAAILASMTSAMPDEKIAAMRPAHMAGLSLGEYTALFAAGAVGFVDTLKLVARRGAAMQAAATAGPSGMIAIMGLDEPAANKLCQSAAGDGVLTCANFNAPGQIVLSGSVEACKRAEEMAKDHGASGAIPLKVAGAFHSSFMKPAADELSKALGEVSFSSPTGVTADKSRPCVLLAQAFASDGVEIIANVDAQPYGCMCGASARLLSQLTGAVRWQQSMELLLARGVERFYEIGPGKVLAGLMRRISRRTEVVVVNGREAVEKLAAEA